MHAADIFRVAPKKELERIVDLRVPLHLVIRPASSEMAQIPFPEVGIVAVFLITPVHFLGGIGHILLEQQAGSLGTKAHDGKKELELGVLFDGEADFVSGEYLLL